MKAQHLFFAPESECREFSNVLAEVQEYISGNYSALLTKGGEDAKAQLKRYIGKYVQENRIAVNGKTHNELTDAIYSEMAEFGFLTKYIFGEGIE